MKGYITLTDASLRDGNHAVRHQLTIGQIARYAQAADEAGIDIVEVGHGNGLGASSALLGKAASNDAEMLVSVRAKLRRSKLGIHFIPGTGKLSDIEVALEAGVDVFRLASHCTEANITRQFIEYVRHAGKTAYGVLMMSHMADAGEILNQSRLMQSYGAHAIVLMDSAGFSTPDLVKEKVERLIGGLSIPVGYHAHNNLGLAIANSIAAAESGATLLDACVRGIGAGAGNTQLETLVPVLERYGYRTGTDFERIVSLATRTDEVLPICTPHIAIANIITGVFGLFSGFAPHIERLASELKIDSFELCQALAHRKLVAGQEDVIVEEAHRLSAMNA
ncbi:4-hydroxy 2-oxovalerate aldolase [Trinickia symbiotica]|uniref:4-hydroxy-2-oxovalerate aldolase n=1 Tax=Trinickia symbiotica TaxID=863227 RepID=A0A2N7X6G4_9BURK|nr:4-hydroxy-2-oxovalerate aldolase [Trinickia symbiotica]PMS37207.1 4-hydroxy-2-oxovalerate aldolase [Trinickia symbiotica]PPK42724.1 4-hydroxy 2-oxovalerate aldolase [Trinickia symbiotica]